MQKIANSLNPGENLHAIHLPQSVREIAEVIGLQKALLLVGQLPRCYVRDGRYPGAQRDQVILYVPTLARLKPAHDLVRILGWQSACALCKAFGGELLKPGNCAGIYRPFRDEHIMRLVREGTPVAMVAEWFDVSERHVKNLVRENPQEDIPAGAAKNAPVSIQRKRRGTNEKRKSA